MFLLSLPFTCSITQFLLIDSGTLLELSRSPAALTEILAFETLVAEESQVQEAVHRCTGGDGDTCVAVLTAGSCKCYLLSQSLSLSLSLPHTTSHILYHTHTHSSSHIFYTCTACTRVSVLKTNVLLIGETGREARCIAHRT